MATFRFAKTSVVVYGTLNIMLSLTCCIVFTSKPAIIAKLSYSLKERGEVDCAIIARLMSIWDLTDLDVAWADTSFLIEKSSIIQPLIYYTASAFLILMPHKASLSYF